MNPVCYRYSLHLPCLKKTELQRNPSRHCNLPELVWPIGRATVYLWSTQVCDTSAPIGNPLIVYSFHGVANWKMKNFVKFSLSSNHKTNSLLGRPTCKEQKHLSEDIMISSMSIIEGATELWISLRKSNFFNIRGGTFFVRNKFLSNIQPSNLAKKQLQSVFKKKFDSRC